MAFHKKLNKIKIGIAVSTFTEKNTDNARYKIIKKSLDSLQRIINKNVFVIIVVDGLIPLQHTQLLSQYNFNIHIRKQNGGVARTKNTSIRLLLEQKIDIGFLADDDVLYKEGVLEEYCKAILKGKIHHIAFTQMHPLVHPKQSWKKMGYIKTNINGQELMKHGGGGELDAGYHLPPN